MKTKKQIVREVRKKMDYDFYFNGEDIGNDINLYLAYALSEGYRITNADIMAISYMAGQSNLRTLFDEKALRKAIDKYDKVDAINRFDTVGETFHDLLGYEFSK
jgi:hypothetical protein